MATLRTVTLSTGFDDYYTVEGIEWGGVTRLAGFHSVASGKGVNSGRAALRLGVPVHAYATVGAADAAEYRRRVDADGLPLTLVPAPGRVRHNLTLINTAAEHPGAHVMGDRPRMSPEDVVPLFDALLADVAPGDIVTLGGAVPPGLPSTTWADLLPRLHEAGAEVIVDAQGEALAACLGGPPVTAFKPNDEEIAALPGVTGAADPVAAALEVMGSTARIPLVSLGSKGVAILLDGCVRRLACPVERAVVSVMAGDTFVAGMAWALLQGERTADQVARHGLAAAAAHVAGADDLLSAARTNLTRVTEA